MQQIKTNKMPQTIWHQFSAQFSMLFQMVCSVLLSVLGQIVCAILFVSFQCMTRSGLCGENVLCENFLSPHAHTPVACSVAAEHILLGEHLFWVHLWIIVQNYSFMGNKYLSREKHINKVSWSNSARKHHPFETFGEKTTTKMLSWWALLVVTLLSTHSVLSCDEFSQDEVDSQFKACKFKIDIAKHLSCA